MTPEISEPHVTAVRVHTGVAGVMVFPPVSASWANPIEARFGPVRTFVMGGSDHRNHTVLARKLQAYLR